MQSPANGIGDEPPKRHFNMLYANEHLQRMRPKNISLRNFRTQQMPRMSAAENLQVLRDLKIWAAETKKTSRTATGKGIARLVEKIVADGRVSKEDESIILYTIEAQRGWWSSMIVMDTLILAIFAALLIYEQPAAKADPELFSAQTREILIFIYNTCIALTFYGALTQLFVILLLFALTSYTFEVKAVLFFFVNCHSLLVALNSYGMAFILPGMTISPVIGQILHVGFVYSIPSIILSIASMIMVSYIYLVYIEPVFTGLYNQEFEMTQRADSKSMHYENDDSDDYGIEEISHLRNNQGLGVPALGNLDPMLLNSFDTQSNGFKFSDQATLLV
ncbi:unnamed protein product [Cylindrotheca closterium]|uniref:Uncharacterized protein n=1 Tax=Cylindrotheca closterium TaxID=2856 RepID=A0AAD2JNG3_9STRA|nr:unnamed protein product [Cylindrotheca closterium]